MLNSKDSRITSLLTFISLALITLAVLPMNALAKDSEKTYPLTGKVVGVGQNPTQVSNARGGTLTMNFHTYKVETESRVYELNCERRAAVHTTGKECGGDQPLEIGSVIHFREEKCEAYLQLPNGKEQKLRILSEDEKPEPKTPDAKPAETK